MNLLQRVERWDKQSKVDEGQSLVSLTHILCKTYGWSYQELADAPIPFVFGLMGEIMEYMANMTKQMNKKGGKKW